jgi:SAM-dependent methyltransferase
MQLLYGVRRRLSRSMDRNRELNWGRDLIVRWIDRHVRAAGERDTINMMDLGCGPGTDLVNVKRAINDERLRLFGVEYEKSLARQARENGIDVFDIDLEHHSIPMEDGACDIVIANHFLEHTKEIFWIVSEVSRILKPGGILIVGLPNLGSLHNRVLLLLGDQPAVIDVMGSHIRGFTAPAFRRFIEAEGYFSISERRGCNFYPFPPFMANPLARAFPTLAVSLMFLVRREPKDGTFIEVLKKNAFDTKFYDGADPPPMT